jgi:hypothetical protein
VHDDESLLSEQDEGLIWTLAVLVCWVVYDFVVSTVHVSVPVTGFVSGAPLREQAKYAVAAVQLRKLHVPRLNVAEALRTFGTLTRQPSVIAPPSVTVAGAVALTMFTAHAASPWTAGAMVPLVKPS